MVSAMGNRYDHLTDRSMQEGKIYAYPALMRISYQYHVQVLRIPNVTPGVVINLGWHCKHYGATWILTSKDAQAIDHASIYIRTMIYAKRTSIWLQSSCSRKQMRCNFSQ